MRMMLRALVAIGLLLVLAVGGLALVLPRILNSPEFQAAASEAAHDALGVPVSWSGLGVGFLPPSIRADDVRVDGVREGDAPLLRAERLFLRLELMPLFSGAIEVDTLEIDGLAVELAMADEGLILPETSEPAPADDPEAGAFDFAVERAVLSRGRIHVVDESVSPAVHYRMEGIALEARGREDRSIALEGSAQLDVTGELVATGELGFELLLDPEIAVPSGRFMLEGDALDVTMEGAFEKAPGTALRAGGRFQVLESGAVRVDADTLGVGPVVGTASLVSDAQTRLLLSTKPVEVKGLEPLLPALRESGVGGRFVVRDLAVVLPELELGGRIELDPISVDLGGTAPIEVRGALVGRRDGLVLDGMSAEAAGQRLRIEGDVKALSGVPRFKLALQSDGVLRANPLAGALAGLTDVLYGPIELKARFAGTLPEDETELYETLTGRFELHVGQGAGDGKEGGRLAGVSILREAMGPFYELGHFMTYLAGIGGKSSLEKYYGDDFQRMDVRFEIRDGAADTEKLQLVYRHYGANLSGRMMLADQSLDMTGEVDLGPEVLRALGAEPTGQGFVIPLASVKGTVAEPSFGVSEKVVIALTQQLLLGHPAAKAVEKSVGDAIGGQLRGLLRNREQ